MRKRGHLCSLAGHVARRHDARQRQRRHEPDPNGRSGGEVGAEAAAEQHLLDVARLDAELPKQDVPAGGDRRLRELQLAHVALRQVHVVGQVEDVLLPHLAEPRRGAERETPRVVEDARADELRHRVHEPGAAEPLRLDVADHGQVDLAVGDLHAFDGAVGGAHAAADLRRLERGPGRRRRAHHTLVRPERDLAVGADVDEEPEPAVARQAGGEEAGHDVAAHVRAHGREHEGRRPLVHTRPELRRPHRRQLVRRHHERRHRQRLGVDPERQLRHRHVAAHRDLVDLLRRDACLLAGLGRDLGERGMHARAQLPECRRVEHCRGDARDHVAAERLLLVEHRAHRHRLAGLEVEQRDNHSGGADIERGREAATAGIAGLDVDHLLVDDHGGHREPGRPQHAAQLAHHLERDVRLEVVDRVEQSLHIGALVLHGRLVQLDKALLHRRAQDHVAADSHERRLRPRLQRRHVHRQVLAGGRAAGEPPPVAQLLHAEGPRVHRAHRHIALQHLHLALAAGPMAAAGGVDGHAVPAGGVEDRRPARDAHLGAVGEEA